MPKVSFYLRNEDVDKWKAITKKTEWIHTHLESSHTVEQYNQQQKPQTDGVPIPSRGTIPPKPPKSEGITYKPTEHWGA